MTFTYADPSASPMEACRFLVGDVDSAQVLLQDEEYLFLLDIWQGETNKYMLASYCAEAIAAKFAREVDLSADSQSLGTNQLMDKYLSLALRLRTMAKNSYAGEIFMGGVDPGVGLDQGALPLSFGTQMHDNPEAGQQDYGDYGSYFSNDGREQWVGPH